MATQWFYRLPAESGGWPSLVKPFNSSGTAKTASDGAGWTNGGGPTRLLPSMACRNGAVPRCNESSSRQFRAGSAGSLPSIAVRRPGYTLVELLVVIAIICLLMGLLATGLQQSWAASHRVQCQNNLRNVNLAMLNVLDAGGRFPACGNFTEEFGRHHSWVVDVLPWLGDSAVAQRWNKDRSIYDPVNRPLTSAWFAVLTCPADVSLSDPGDRKGDLSYVVNGGVGFTVFYEGVHDCPIDVEGRKLDLDGDGVSCPNDAGSGADKALFQQMGLFFNETWKSDVTARHHTAASVTDGLSNTVILSENVRTGFNPSVSDDPWASSWASPSPMLTCFHIGNPCRDARCSPGEVDYRRSNAGNAAINSGLTRPEGSSPVPNSFHAGGVNMAFGDGRVQLLAESVDGGVYAAVCSPQGAALAGTPLEQPYFGGSF